MISIIEQVGGIWIVINRLKNGKDTVDAMVGDCG